MAGPDTTLGDMANRIADELGARTDLLAPSTGMNTDPIHLAIFDAISQWDQSRYWFNEYRVGNAFTTKIGQEFYDLNDWPDIATIHHIDKLSVMISGNRYFMSPRTEEYMEDISINPSWTGQPQDYSYYNLRLRFYPIPNGIYPVNVLGTKQFPPLVSDSDSNVWTTTAEPLIRATAKLYLYRDTLQDDERAQAMAQAMNFENSSIRSETQQRVPVTRFKPTQW